MRLQKLHLVNFKNYAEAQVEFKGMVHCFLGKNGSGKTNLLEAIHYLCFTKGSLHAHDLSNVRHGQDHFLINGLFEVHGKIMDVRVSVSPERKKTIVENGAIYTRFSEHIGKYPLVMVAPGDSELIGGGGEVRRRLLDTLLSQTDKEYLEHLITYQAHLRQRNGLLKMFAEGRSIDRDLLDTYDLKMVSAGKILYDKRAEFTRVYGPLLSARYDFLSNASGEAAAVTYVSDLTNMDFREQLQQNLDRDISSGRTTVGIHRDDFLFTLSGHELKRFGSQGQQKSFLIALKLAEFDFLLTKNGTRPLLLLDDIFDKLDDERIHQLMQLVTGGAFGQIFITDARPGRSLDVLRNAGVASQNFLVDGGIIRPK